MKVLVIGATSAIAEATARIWAGKGHHLCLIARNRERLDAIAADLSVRGAGSLATIVLDLNEMHRHEQVVEEAAEALGGIDIVLVAHGTLGEQEACERDFDLAMKEFTTNALSVFSLLTLLANRFEGQAHGTIAVISSVAGDRGRQSNYIYGSAKGAVTLYLQGLRQRLYKSGVHVVTIKPGFVDTPMTAGFEKGLLWAKPDQVARGIHSAIDKKRNVAYVPWFWQIIMLVIKAIPESIMKRLSL
ncbi:MAG: SDR family oxidoreductase [Sedimenticola sp.]|nr:SDR family oxidoreductase [Sedimenticola sp.]